MIRAGSTVEVAGRSPSGAVCGPVSKEVEVWDEETVSPDELKEFERLLAASAPADDVDEDTLDEPPPKMGSRVAEQMKRLEHARYAVGIELLSGRIVGALVDEHGSRLAAEQMLLDDMSVDGVVDGAHRMTSVLLDTVPYVKPSDGRVVLELQLGGPVDLDGQTVLFYHKAPPEAPTPVKEITWLDRRPLGRLLQQATGLESAVSNDAVAYATYQQWFGAGREVADFAVVLIREGVGGALVHDHARFKGPMEIGNLCVLPDSESKRMCDCGNRGCLETTGGITGILDAVYLKTQRSVATVVEAAELAEQPGTSEALNAFDRAGYANAKGIGVIVNFANPQRVVLYAPPVMLDTDSAAGRMFRTGVQQFREFAHSVYDCELVFEPLHPYDGAHGAALLALERRFGVNPDAARVNAERSR